MADAYFEPPVATGGTEEEQLRGLYRYLWQMSAKLNEALTTVTMEQLDPQVQQQIRTAGETSVKSAGEYNGLKSMIIKTANVVRHEMDVIAARLQEEYQAISDDFGTLEESLESRIEATARGVVQLYDYDSKITRLDGEIEKRVTSQYIYSGMLTEQGGVPEFGIAVGYNVTTPEGELDDQNKFATFTAKELAFYVNGVKTAWFSNSVFNINEGQIIKSLQMGTAHIWQIFSGNLVLVSLQNEEE